MRWQLWMPPPAATPLTCCRSDAVDVLYETPTLIVLNNRPG